MKKQIIKLVVGLLILVFGWILYKKGDGMISQSTLDEYKKCCKQWKMVYGQLNDSCKIAIRQNKTEPSSEYQCIYHFILADSIYYTTCTLDLAGAKDSIPLWYNPNNPRYNTSSNICRELEHLQKTKTIGNSRLYSFGGLIICIVSFGFVWSVFRVILSLLIAKKKKDKE